MRPVRTTTRVVPLSVLVVLALTVTIAAGSGQLRQSSRQLLESVGVTEASVPPRDLKTPVAPIEDAAPARLAAGVVPDTETSGTAEEAQRQLSSESTRSLDPTPPLAPVALPALDDDDDDESSRQAVAGAQTTPSTAPPTTATPTTAPPTTVRPTTTAPTTTIATTTTAPAPVPKGDAGHSGSVGCVGECANIGFQDLDGSNGVVLENVRISNPGGRCLTIRNAQNVTLRNVTIENCGTDQAVTGNYDTGLILIENSSNVTIENSKIRNFSAGRFSEFRNNAIQLKNSPNARIVNNIIRDIHSDISTNGGNANWGNRSIMVTGDAANLTIEKNSFLNAGRNALQISGVQGVRGLSFSYNIVSGRGPWDSDYEDMINMYSTSGTPDSPIVIRGNYMRNGGPSSSGTAIIVGDGNSGNGANAYVVVDKNVIVNPGNVGINIAGGHHATITDNIVYGDANVPHTTVTGIGINHYGYTGECNDHVITGNRVYMKNQHLPSGTNHLWNPGTCWNMRVENNVWGDESLSGSIWNP